MHRQRQTANWDDLRFVLAVADKGSVSAAARALGVNHATVLRRIAAFEPAEGAPVFERTPGGYVVPPDKLPVIEAAREAEAAMAAVSRTLRVAGPPLSGSIRVTSTDTFCMTLLPQITAEIQARMAGVQIDLICTNAHLDLARMHADITVRPARTLPDNLSGQQAGVLGMAVYAAPGHRRTVWLGLRGVLAQSIAGVWMAREVPPERVVGGADSFVVLREMAALGIGQAVLPCVLAEGDARLVRLAGAAPPMVVPIWVASHIDLAQAQHLKLARAGLAEALLARASQLAGEATAAAGPVSAAPLRADRAHVRIDTRAEPVPRSGRV